jgi:hypothetical protein
MEELFKKEVSKEELDRGLPLNNMVLCRMFYTNVGAKTKSGIVWGFNNDLTYASEDGKDTSSHLADCVEITLDVYRTPQSLYFNPDDSKGMDFETTMELAKGDIVWTNPIDALNAITPICEGEEYKLINYADIYVCKRTIQIEKTVEWDKETGLPRYVDWFDQMTICLNGYCLLKQVQRPKLSELDIISGNQYYKDRGIVEYFGTPNIRHRSPEVVDFQDVQKGDLVLLDRKCTPFLLERNPYASRFSETPLWVVPRKYINLVLKRND